MVWDEIYSFIINLNSKDYYGWFHFKYQSISESGMNLLSNATIKVGQKIWLIIDLDLEPIKPHIEHQCKQSTTANSSLAQCIIWGGK